MKSITLARRALLGIVLTTAFGSFAVCQDGTEISAVEVIPEASHATSLPLQQIAPDAVHANGVAARSGGKGTVSTTIGLSFDGVGSSPGKLTADTSGAV